MVTEPAEVTDDLPADAEQWDGHKPPANTLVVDHVGFDLKVHNGWITIRSKKTGDHRVFAIRVQKSGQLAGNRIVAVCQGRPQERDSWKGFGFVNLTKDGSRAYIAVWKKMRGEGNQRSEYEVFADMLQNPTKYLNRAEYQVALRCRRCDMLLTHPDSLADGLGPTCRKKMEA